MKLFKKKVKKKVKLPTVSIVDFYNELSSVALEAEYNHLQEDYKYNPNERIGTILQIISKILNDRAYDQGNGKLFKEARELIPKLTEEKFKTMTKEEKQNLQKLIDNKKELDVAFKELAKPQPELEISIKTDHASRIIQDIDETKPKKKPGFFKKRIPIKPDLLKEAQASVNLDHDPKLQTMSEPPKKKKSIFQKLNEPIFQKKQEKTEQKATQNLLKNIIKKKNDVKLPDLYCPDCSHSIKSHQSKGKSVGCKCGCLNTIEQIAEKHGVNLNKPAVVLEKIKQENTQKDPMDDVIVAQAKKMSSMTTKRLTNPPAEVPQPKKTKSLCANCDHVPSAHFDSNKFCTVIGCTCETYRAYPE